MYLDHHVRPLDGGHHQEGLRFILHVVREGDFTCAGRQAPATLGPVGDFGDLEIGEETV